MNGFVNVENTRSICIEDGLCSLCIDIDDFYIYESYIYSNEYNVDVCLTLLTKHCMIDDMNDIYQIDCFTLYNNTYIENCSKYRFRVIF